MDQKTKEIFSEVNSILEMLGDEYIAKIPQKLYRMVKDNCLDSYHPVYTTDRAFSEQNMKRESIALLVLFQLNYWCDTEEEKKSIQDTLEKNSEKKNMEMRERYSSQNIFKEINAAREKQRIEEEELRKVSQLVDENQTSEKDDSKDQKGFFKHFLR